MKVVIIGLCCTLAVLAYPRPEEKYTSKYDNVDLDQILSSDRLLKNYVNCVMDRGPCSPDGGELKKVLPEALKTDCIKCTEKQRESSKKVIVFLIKNKRPIWDELQEKYDKDNVYISKHTEELKKEGVTL